MPLAPIKPYGPAGLTERFSRFVTAAEGPGCWEWRGARIPCGYGVFRRNGKGTTAHRVAWQIANGREPPADMDVCHTCDNRICVRPDHLFLGTPSDNMRDMVSKGRNWHPPMTGELHSQARLTDVDVARLRAMREAGATYDALAQEFGITTKYVWKVLARRTWAHI